MQVSTSGLTACAFVLAAGLVAAEEKEVISDMPDTRMQKILENHPGVSNIELLEKSEDAGQPYRFKIKTGEDSLLVVLFNKGENMQLYAGWRDTAVSLTRINEWNRDKRFSKAYVDKDGDPCIESDIDLTGGLTEENVHEWIRTYRRSLTSFQEHISK